MGRGAGGDEGAEEVVASLCHVGLLGSLFALNLFRCIPTLAFGISVDYHGAACVVRDLYGLHQGSQSTGIFA